jgi:hypothetical protein
MRSAWRRSKKEVAALRLKEKNIVLSGSLRLNHPLHVLYRSVKYGLPTLSVSSPHSPTVSELHSHQDTLPYSMFRAQLSSHEREIDFHVSLK